MNLHTSVCKWHDDLAKFYLEVLSESSRWDSRNRKIKKELGLCQWVTHDMLSGGPGESLVLPPCPGRFNSLKPSHCLLWVEVRRQKSFVKIQAVHEHGVVYYHPHKSPMACFQGQHGADTRGSTGNPYRNSEYSRSISSARRLSLVKILNAWGCWESVNSNLCSSWWRVFPCWRKDCVLSVWHNRSGDP